MDLSLFVDKAVIIKGCTKKSIPVDAYFQIVDRLKPITKTIMFGEACSSVPLYKKKNN